MFREIRKYFIHTLNKRPVNIKMQSTFRCLHFKFMTTTNSIRVEQEKVFKHRVNFDVDYDVFAVVAETL